MSQGPELILCLRREKPAAQSEGPHRGAGRAVAERGSGQLPWAPSASDRLAAVKGHCPPCRVFFHVVARGAWAVLTQAFPFLTRLPEHTPVPFPVCASSRFSSRSGHSTPLVLPVVSLLLISLPRVVVCPQLTPLGAAMTNPASPRP